MKIILVRHGETNTKAKVFYGSTDVELSARGKKQSIQMVNDFLKNGVELVITSGLERSDYVGKLARAKSIPCIFNTSFREVDFGLWEGLTWQEVEDTYPAEARQWLSSPDTMVFPNGERVEDLKNRVLAAWRRVLKRPENNLAIVCHSSVIAVILQSEHTTTKPKYFNHGQSVLLEA